MYDGQTYANVAAAPNKITYVKHLTRRRGRADKRREKRGTCTESRIMRDKLAASFAHKEYRKEMNQFEKTVKEASGRGIKDIPVPEFLAELRSNAKLHEGNLEMAQITHAAMNQFPPLPR